SVARGDGCTTKRLAANEHHRRRPHRDPHTTSAAPPDASGTPRARRGRLPDDGAVLLAALLVAQAAERDLPSAAGVLPVDVALRELLPGAFRSAVPAVGAEHA